MIRAARERDTPAVLAIYEPVVRETAISFETEPPSEEEVAARIARSHEWLLLEREGEVIGYAYGAIFSPTARVQMACRDIGWARNGYTSEGVHEALARQALR